MGKRRTVLDFTRRTETIRDTHSYPIQLLKRVGEGVLVEREYINHPHIKAARCIYLPRRHLRASFFTAHAGVHPYRCYIDMMQIHDGGTVLDCLDLYLDVIVFHDGRWTMVDMDEYLAAVQAGEVTREQQFIALRGLDHACRLVHEARGDLGAHLERLLEEQAAD